MMFSTIMLLSIKVVKLICKFSVSPLFNTFFIVSTTLEHHLLIDNRLLKAKYRLKFKK